MVRPPARYIQHHVDRILLHSPQMQSKIQGGSQTSIIERSCRIQYYTLHNTVSAVWMTTFSIVAAIISVFRYSYLTTDHWQSGHRTRAVVEGVRSVGVRDSRQERLPNGHILCMVINAMLKKVNSLDISFFPYQNVKAKMHAKIHTSF